jgi:hypothetical protein
MLLEPIVRNISASPGLALTESGDRRFGLDAPSTDRPATKPLVIGSRE